MTRTAAVAVLLLLATAAPAQDWGIINKAVVRVACIDGSGGTGTVIHVCEDGTAYVLTCKHVVPMSQVRITWSDGYSCSGVVVQYGQSYDTAIIRVTRPGCAAISLADDFAPQGSTAIAIGYGGQYGIDIRRLRLVYFKSRVTGYMPWGDNTSSLCLEHPAAMSGDSGGPIINEQTQIIGIISGYTDTRTVGPPIGPIRKLFRAILPHGIIEPIDNRRATQGRYG